MKTDIQIKIISVVAGGVVVVLGILSSCKTEQQSASFLAGIETHTPASSAISNLSGTLNLSETETILPTESTLILQIQHTGTPADSGVQPNLTPVKEGTPESIGTSTEEPSPPPDEFDATPMTITSEVVPLTQPTTNLIGHGGTLPTSASVTAVTGVTESTLATPSSTLQPPATDSSSNSTRTPTSAIVIPTLTPPLSTALISSPTLTTLKTSTPPTISVLVRPTVSTDSSKSTLSLQEQLEALKASLAETQKRLDGAESDRELLESQLEDANVALLNVLSLLESSQENTSALEMERDQLIATINSLQSNIAVLDNEIRNLDEEISIRKDEISRLDRIITETHQQEQQQQLWDILSPILGAISGVLITIVIGTVFSGIVSIKSSSVVKRGAMATLEIYVAKGVSCTPIVIDNAGKERALKKQIQQTGIIGKLSWRWKVPSDAATGEAIIRVQCFPSGKNLERKFNIE